MSTITPKIAASADDADENGAGTCSISAATSRVRNTGSSTANRSWGGRFAVDVPQAATILSATLGLFVTASVDGIDCGVAVQTADNAQAFDSGSANRITGSGRTWAAESNWTNPSPTTGSYNDFDLTAAVQTLVNRGGWAAGNFIAVRVNHFTSISDTDFTVQNYDGSATNAARLAIEYEVAEPENEPPTVDAGPDRTAYVGVPITLSGNVSDDGLPDPPGEIEIEGWAYVSGPGGVSFAGGDNVTLTPTLTFSIAGSHVLELLATDGDLEGADSITITVLPLVPAWRLGPSASDASDPGRIWEVAP